MDPDLVSGPERSSAVLEAIRNMNSMALMNSIENCELNTSIFWNENADLIVYIIAS